MMKGTIQKKFKPAWIVGTAQKLIEVLCNTSARWLSPIMQAFKDRIGIPCAPVASNVEAFEVGSPGWLLQKHEAVTIMEDAIRRGASRLDLARVAVVAAREVLPLVRVLKSEAQAVVEAAEAWGSNPCAETANAVSAAKDNLEAGPQTTPSPMEINHDENLALMAIGTAAMACFFIPNVKLLSVLAVQCACDAAGPKSNLTAVVTAALL